MFTVGTLLPSRAGWHTRLIAFSFQGPPVLRKSTLSRCPAGGPPRAPALNRRLPSSFLLIANGSEGWL